MRGRVSRERRFPIPATTWANHWRMRPPEPGSDRRSTRFGELTQSATKKPGTTANHGYVIACWTCPPVPKRSTTAQASAAERPVVDREAARGMSRGEDPEPGDHRAHRQAKREHRAVVHPRDVPNGEHVAQVGDDLAAEANREPGGDDVLHRVHE